MEETKSFVEGATSVEAVLLSQSRKVEKIYIDKEISGRKNLALFPLKAKAERFKVPVEYVERCIIDEIANGTTHGGVLAFVGDREYKTVDEMLKNNDKGFYVMLDGIEDPFNFGQALRAVYAAGADGVILPKRNWMSASSVVARSSAGASEYIDASVCDPEEALAKFKKAGYKIVCTDKTPDAVSMTKAPLKRPIVLMIGGEKRGISAKLKAYSDLTAMISYGRSFGASLGAAEACAILAFEVARQNLDEK